MLDKSNLFYIVLISNNYLASQGTHQEVNISNMYDDLYLLDAIEEEHSYLELMESTWFKPNVRQCRNIQDLCQAVKLEEPGRSSSSLENVHRKDKLACGSDCSELLSGNCQRGQSRWFIGGEWMMSPGLRRPQTIRRTDPRQENI